MLRFMVEPMRKLTTDEFIKRARLIHGNKFDYSKVEYINTMTKILIKCNICNNEFWQRPSAHLQSQGCPNCSIKKKYSNSTEFIKKAKKVHGDKYNYSGVKYNGNRVKICIKCTKHGLFYQSPHEHLSGCGCPKCGLERRIGLQTYTQEDFIKKANQVHSNIYDYNLVKYIGNKKKVIIVCNKHGKFLQTPADHLQGVGCPKCNLSKGEKCINKILTNNNIRFQPQKKFIGCKDKRQLPFDFYLPEYNIAIEYDGEQHYLSRSLFNGKKGFKETQQHDLIKNNYCYNNDIMLLRIRYDEDIYSKINEFIKLKEI